MLRHALRIIFLYLFFMPSVWAGGSLVLVLSDNAAPYKEFTSSFNEAMQNSSWKITPALSGRGDFGPPPNLIVTVGIDAFRETLPRAGNTPVIATMIGRQIYQKILAESGRPRGRSTAIYIEQPYSRQAAFIRHLLPGKKRAGVLVSSDGRSELSVIRQAFLNSGMSLDTEDSETDESLLPAANTLFDRVDFLLATPDAKIYKRDQIKTLLLTSYRHQKPVIAFSSAFVTAGAVAAIFSSPKQIARQSAQMVIDHGSNLVAPEYPDQFSIAINRNVADALNLHFADEIDIRRALTGSKDFK